jgi:hypothetical protein
VEAAALCGIVLCTPQVTSLLRPLTSAAASDHDHHHLTTLTTLTAPIKCYLPAPCSLRTPHLQVAPKELGVRYPAWFLCTKSYWQEVGLIKSTPEVRHPD